MLRSARPRVAALLTAMLVSATALGSSTSASAVPPPDTEGQPSAAGPDLTETIHWPPLDSGPPIEPLPVESLSDLKKATESLLADAVEVPPAPAPEVEVPPGPETVRFAHANIFTGLSAGSFAADLREVISHSPDFVTLNEADWRSDQAITPVGYDSYRGTQDRWARETPVLWRTDRWTPLDAGSTVMHARPGHKWGKRTANWVTLRSTSGRVVSVISAHTSPTVPGTTGLLNVYMQHVNNLAARLAVKGDVLLGGDLNVGYQGRAYPGGLLAAGGLSTTFDLLGRPAGGTGDHHGAIIDYIVFKQNAALVPLRQGKFELLSDHDGLWADFRLG
jgi:endonuclease/exonuclease/phosphatase (EEP) superfamily protein YafD